MECHYNPLKHDYGVLELELSSVRTTGSHRLFNYMYTRKVEVVTNLLPTIILEYRSALRRILTVMQSYSFLQHVDFHGIID